MTHTISLVYKNVPGGLPPPVCSMWLLEPPTEGESVNAKTILFHLNTHWEITLEVQWLGLHSLIAKGQGSIPMWGTKIP